VGRDYSGGGPTSDGGGGKSSLGHKALSALSFGLKVLDAPRHLVDKYGDEPWLATPTLGASMALHHVGDLRDKHPKGVLGFLRNTAVDVAQDPLTYASFGTGSAAKAGLKAVGEHLGETVAKDVVEQGARKALDSEARARLLAALASKEGGSEKAAGKVLKALDRGGQGGIKVLGRTVVAGKRFEPLARPFAALEHAALASKAGQALVPRAGIRLKFGKDTADAIGGAAARARAEAGNASHNTIVKIAKATKEAGATKADLERTVLPALDVGGKSAVVPERLQPLVDDLAGIRRDFTDRQVAEGLLPAIRPTEEYVPLRFTEAGKKALGHDPAFTERHLGVMPDDLHTAFRQGGALKERTILPDHPIRTVESAIGGSLRDAGKLEGDLVEKNPAMLIGARAAGAERAIAEKHFLDEMTNLKAPSGEALLHRAEEGVQRPAGWVEVDAGQAGKYYAPKEIAGEVQRVRDVVTNDEALKEFQGLMGRMQTWWKSQATAGSIIGGLGFFNRNALGNFWNAFLMGAKNPADFVRAGKIQQAVAHGGLESLSEADRAVYELAVKHGVLDEGFFMSELTAPHRRGGRIGRAVKAADGKERAIKVARQVNPLSTESAPIRAGRALNNVVEQNARLGLFIDQLHKLSSAEEAAHKVRQALFDYGDLTATDRQIKKVVSFWTWSRKNLPFQIAALAHEPGKFSGLAHAQHNVGAGDQLPDYARADAMRRVGNMAVGADVPAFAALKLFSPEPDTALNLTSGPLPSLVKVLAEQKTGKSLFTGGRLTDNFAQRTAEGLLPPVGKIRRAPYTAYAKGDYQAPARLLTAATGLKARHLTPQDKAGGPTVTKRSKKKRSY
jgi:hypothetical protein